MKIEHSELREEDYCIFWIEARSATLNFLPRHSALTRIPPAFGRKIITKVLACRHEANASVSILRSIHMAITKQKKSEILEKLKTIVKEAGALAFVNFHGLTVADIMEVRRGLRKADVGYFVAKKTLMKKALQEGSFQGTLPELSGEIGLAWSKDSVAPAREIFTFEKKFEKKIALVGGVFEGKFLNKQEIGVIASIPSRQTLYAQFVNLINSPRQRFAVVLSEKAKKSA